MVVELKAFFFKTLYQWVVAYNCLHISSFLNFLYFIFYFSVKVFLLFISYVLELHPFAF